jgi:hypothetical protein
MKVRCEEIVMRWIWILIAAVVLLPLVWKLLSFALGFAFGLLHLAILLAVVIFLVGLIRRLMLLR